MNKLYRLLGIILLAPTIVFAHISIQQTRIIILEGERETTLEIKNHGEEEALFQVWLDKDEDPYTELPFAVTPSFSKLKADSSQTIRVLAQGKTSLPSDRESLYWFNAQEIPKVSTTFLEGAASGLAFSIRHRIKLFYRPASIKTNPIDMTEKLIFDLDTNSNSLTMNNQSGNFITLVNFKSIFQDNTPVPILDDSVMLFPMTSTTIRLNESIKENNVILFESMNDYGYAIKFELNLTDSKSPIKAQSLAK